MGCIGRLDQIVLLCCFCCISGSLDIAGTGSYRIIMAGCKDGMDGTDMTDGNDGNDGQMGRWREWGGRLLAPAGTGATEQKRHHWLAG